MSLMIRPLVKQGQQPAARKKSSTYHVALCHPLLVPILALLETVMKNESADYVKDLGDARDLISSPAFWLGISTEETLQSGARVPMVDRDGKPTLDDCSVFVYTEDPERDFKAAGEKAGLLIKAKSFNTKFPAAIKSHPYWAAALAGYRTEMGVGSSSPKNTPTNIPTGSPAQIPVGIPVGIPAGVASAPQNQVPQNLAPGDIEIAAR